MHLLHHNYYQKVKRKKLIKYLERWI